MRFCFTHQPQKEIIMIQKIYYSNSLSEVKAHFGEGLLIHDVEGEYKAIYPDRFLRSLTLRSHKGGTLAILDHDLE